MDLIMETIQKRHSVRNYSSQAIEKEKLALITKYIESNNTGPLGNRMRFQVIDGTAYRPEELKELGSYGFIRGARLFIAGAVSQNRYAMEDYGYCMEKNILKVTSLGLGTCWLGGSLNRSAFGRKLAAQGDEIMAAVTPIGYAAAQNTLVGNALELITGARKRKKPAELFFDGGFHQPLDLKQGGRLATVLEGVRQAPSAANFQPWRIVKHENACHFYLRENEAYNNNGRYQGAKLQNIDIGIAMAHFDLVSAAVGFQGQWRIADPGLEKKGLKYIVSWVETAA